MSLFFVQSVKNERKPYFCIYSSCTPYLFVEMMFLARQLETVEHTPSTSLMLR